MVRIAKPKGLTLRAKVELMKGLLLEIQKKKFHEPDSDFHEYCNGCGRSPYNVPAHSPDCLVPRLSAVLKQV